MAWFRISRSLELCEVHFDFLINVPTYVFLIAFITESDIIGEWEEEKNQLFAVLIPHRVTRSNTILNSALFVKL